MQKLFDEYYCSKQAVVKKRYQQKFHLGSRFCLFRLFLESLPRFLRPYTAAWLHILIIWHCVDVFQKLRRYEAATDCLRWLLDNTANGLLCNAIRGRFWERMALNLDAHLQEQRAVRKSSPSCFPCLRYLISN